MWLSEQGVNSSAGAVASLHARVAELEKLVLCAESLHVHLTFPQVSELRSENADLKIQLSRFQNERSNDVTERGPPRVSNSEMRQPRAVAPAPYTSQALDHNGVPLPAMRAPMYAHPQSVIGTMPLDQHAMYMRQPLPSMLVRDPSQGFYQTDSRRKQEENGVFQQDVAQSIAAPSSYKDTPGPLTPYYPQ